MAYPSDSTYQKTLWEGEFSPAAEALTYGATLSTDASTYPRRQQFTCTLTGSVTVAAPTNGRDGQVLQFYLTADSGVTPTISLGATIVAPALKNNGVVAATKTRFIEITYNGTEWFLTGDEEESKGGRVSVITLPIDPKSWTASGDVVTNFHPGFRGKLLAASFLCNRKINGTTGRATFNFEVGTTNVTGGTGTITYAAGMQTRGLVTAFSSMTPRAFGATGVTGSISVEITAGTAATGGDGAILLTVQEGA